MNDLASWLTEHHTDGVNLGMPELLQYKAKTALLDLAPKRTMQARLAGSYLTKMKGRGMEFDEARHYQPGDDIRAIDWRVTARTGKTHTKLFREEKERPVFILIDLSATMHFGTQCLYKSVQAAHLASLIAWSAQKRGDRLGGLVFNDEAHREFKPLTRHKAVLSFLQGIIDLHTPDYQGHNPSAFSDALSRLRRLARPGSMIAIISDFHHFDDLAKQHISQLSRHCEVSAFPISDPFEHTLPSVSVPQHVAITDGESQQSIVLGDKKTETEYQQRHAKKLQDTHESLKQHHVQILPINAGQGLEDQLLTAMGRVR